MSDPVSRQPGVVLFGASGFIGMNMLAHLQRMGIPVIPFSLRGATAIGKATRAMAEAPTTTVPTDTVVINMAAHRYDAGTFKASQGEILARNSALSSAVYEFCARNGVSEVRQASSIAVYGASCTSLDDRVPEYPPRWDEDPFPSELMYGWSKRIAETCAHIYQRKHGIFTISFRLTNPYGRYDCTDVEAAHVVPAFILRALQTTGTFTVRGNPEATRDFIHVDDVCRVITASLAVRGRQRSYNLGTGVNTSIATLADAVLRGVGTKRTVVGAGAATSDVVHRRVLIEALRRDFPLPTFLDLDEGLARTIPWYRNPDA